MPLYTTENDSRKSVVNIQITKKKKLPKVHTTKHKKTVLKKVFLE